MGRDRTGETRVADAAQDGIVQSGRAEGTAGHDRAGMGSISRDVQWRWCHLSVLKYRTRAWFSRARGRCASKNRRDGKSIVEARS